MSKEKRQRPTPLQHTFEIETTPEQFEDWLTQKIAQDMMESGVRTQLRRTAQPDGSITLGLYIDPADMERFIAWSRAKTEATE